MSVKKIDGDETAYLVTLHASKVTVNATLHFPGSIWSSQAYVPFCEAAMNQLKVLDAPAGMTPKGNPLGDLLDFSESSIEAENARISQWLTEEPGNAFAQEQAALVLGTLAMKENSGWFWDPRDVCNYATAHLAVARSLNSGTDLGVEGQLAECLVGLIADTKKECAEEWPSDPLRGFGASRRGRRRRADCLGPYVYRGGSLRALLLRVEVRKHLLLGT